MSSSKMSLSENYTINHYKRTMSEEAHKIKETISAFEKF